MLILALDPGDTQTGWCEYDTNTQLPVHYGLDPNPDVLSHIQRRTKADALVIEMIASYGMPVGKSIFDTCVWIGRYEQAWIEMAALILHPPSKIERKQVKMHLCGTTGAKDSNIRQAVMDRYGSTRERAIGVKANPGPCYGMKKDIWAATALAITAAETTERYQEASA